jgi:hypothetical protein
MSGEVKIGRRLITVRPDKPNEDEVLHAARHLFNEAAKGSALAGSYLQVAAWLQSEFKLGS